LVQARPSRVELASRVKQEKGKRPASHRSTSYRCCLPALTEFRGSWSCGTCPSLPAGSKAAGDSNIRSARRP